MTQPAHELETASPSRVEQSAASATDVADQQDSINQQSFMITKEASIDVVPGTPDTRRLARIRAACLQYDPLPGSLAAEILAILDDRTQQ